MEFANAFLSNGYTHMDTDKGQACWRDWQSLLSPPFTPSTYHVWPASAAGTRVKNKVKVGSILNATVVSMIARGRQC